MEDEEAEEIEGDGDLDEGEVNQEVRREQQSKLATPLNKDECRNKRVPWVLPGAPVVKCKEKFVTTYQSHA